ncbi:hypothetical protein QFZ34_002072 [Phyllobacterium ifriqiyense]|uniref:Transposase n=1 Tax=Phyllobacterium ifriqiyense TaxID=314238 RepID=A0ABU0S815_9HYPH|nr:hypothetical protein [Phyllobacterium ifriqiyense]MDQ0996890.1 hypothetical protein [Phyllobacterium ifriqiyense]
MTEKPTKPLKGGRPQYRPTIKERVTVEQMKFCGESDNIIARALGIDADTMRKHFAEELENGYANRRRELVGYLFEAASQKNVAAIKKLEEMGRVASSVEAAKDRETRSTKEEKLGKKDQRQATANSVSGKFAVPTPPKLVVHNK